MLPLYLLAQAAQNTATIPPPSIGWIVASAAAAALAYREISGAVRQMSGRGDAVEVTNAALKVRITGEYVTQHELQELKTQVTALSVRLEEIPRTLSAASEERMNRVHDQIQTLQKEVSGMPERIVGLLKTMGKL